MIKVDDLIEWARQNAIGRSTSYPNGWIDATALKKLAEQVEQTEPLPYFFRTPAADAVQVVRCKECIFRFEDDWCDRVNDWVCDDEFCSSGVMDNE